MDIRSCPVALKEWAITCRALEAGRQIILLRKGGILDEDGVFALEHNAFWLQPTYEHQSENRVKPEHRDLFTTVEAERQSGENRKFIMLQSLAIVDRVYALTEADWDKLRQIDHIWSDEYLELRFDYKPQHPLLCVALRVYVRNEPHIVPMREAYFGCRSWIDLETALDCSGLRPALQEGAFNRAATQLEEILSGVAKARE